MKLELDIINIKDVQFAEKTTISDGVIYINRSELQELLQQDKRFSEANIELAHSGESCRVVQVFDMTEPRCKVGGSGVNFPGVLGRVVSAGEGRTRVLRGAVVVAVDFTIGSRGLIIEMSGPGTELGPYGNLQNIVLLCRPAEGITHYEYQNALRIAGLKTAVYLAKAADDLQADRTEVYNLGPLSEACKGLEHLPRIAYVYQIHSLQHSVDRPQNEPIFYGNNVSGLLPTIVHPNEILDGSILRGYFCQGQETYAIQNHPLVRELYSRHGKELCFVGVVATVAQVTQPERERAATMAAKLVKSVLGADGAILTKIGGGAPHIDLAQTCEICEELGVKTTVLVADQSTSGTSEGALIFNTPRADAIVNVGGFSTVTTLPPVKRVIGGPVTFSNNTPAEGEIVVSTNVINGALSQIGGSKQMRREF